MSCSRIIRTGRSGAGTVVIGATVVPVFPHESEELAPPPDPTESLLHQAQETLQRARLDAERIRIQAAVEGRADGYQEGLAAVHRELAEAVEKVSVIAESVHVLHGELLQRIERDVVELALSVARKVIEGELSTRPELVQQVIAGALREIEQGTMVRVRVNPDDVRLLESWWADFLPAEQRAAIQLLADSHVERGGCLVDTRSGMVDGQLWTRFEQLSAALLEEAEPGRERRLLSDESQVMSAE